MFDVRVFRVAVLALLVSLVAWAHADGTFAKLGANVDHAAPGIPYQRAIVAYRNGVETMVVESTLNGSAGDYAWIVPLPSPPTRVTAVAPDALMVTTRRNLRPSVAVLGFGLSSLGQAIGVGLTLVGFVVGLLGFGTKNRVRNGLAAIAAVVLWIFALLVFYPVFAGPSTPTLDPRSRFLVGNYDVKILKARDAGALDNWLRERGGELSPRARQAAEAYGRDGWCFAVAHLREHPGGRARPHPIAFEFRAPRPIYPMRLTGTQTDALVLDLIVLSAGSAELPELPTWVSQKARSSYEGTQVDAGFLADSPLEALSWKDATVTRLRGELRPEQMNHDFEIRTKPRETQRIQLTTERLLTNERWALTLVCGGLALFVVASGTAFAGWGSDRRIAWAVLASVAFGLGAYTSYAPGAERIEPGIYRAVR
jgi:hypothetical protein